MIRYVKLLLGFLFFLCQLANATDRLPDDLNSQIGTHQTLSFIEHCKDHEIVNLITHPRIHLGSVPKSDGFEAGHQLLDYLRDRYSPLGNFSAILISEGTTDWVRAQIGTFKNEEEANETIQVLKKFFPKYYDFYVLPANVVSKEGGKLIEAAELHHWEC